MCHNVSVGVCRAGSIIWWVLGDDLRSLSSESDLLVEPFCLPDLELLILGVDVVLHAFQM